MIIESLMSDQLKLFLDSDNILNPMQSGSRPRHSNVTTSLKVLDHIKAAIDKKQSSVVLLDLTRAFDTVDH